MAAECGWFASLWIQSLGCLVKRHPDPIRFLLAREARGICPHVCVHPQMCMECSECSDEDVFLPMCATQGMGA